MNIHQNSDALEPISGLSKVEEILPKYSDFSVPGVYIVEIPGSPYIYIGSTGNLNQRKRQHRSELNRGIHSNQKLQLLYSPKNGVDFKVAQRTQTREAALALEQELLDQHKNNPFCLNIATNARVPAAGMIRSDETRAKISQALKGRRPTEESKEKMRQAQIGRTHSKETKQRMSESHKGTTHSEDTKQQMSKARKGILRSEETKQRMRTPRSEEAKEKIKQGALRRWQAYRDRLGGDAK